MNSKYLSFRPPYFQITKALPILYTAANDSKIKTCGKKLLNINLNFLLYSTIGADFLNIYGLFVDIKHLLDLSANISITAITIDNEYT